MSKVSVFGAGAWGSTLAQVLCDAGNEVVLWLTGGTPGEEYFVQVTAQTSQGRRKTVDGSITIIDPTTP